MAICYAKDRLGVYGFGSVWDDKDEAMVAFEPMEQLMAETCERLGLRLPLEDRADIQRVRAEVAAMQAAGVKTPIGWSEIEFRRAVRELLAEIDQGLASEAKARRTMPGMVAGCLLFVLVILVLRYLQLNYWYLVAMGHGFVGMFLAFSFYVSTSWTPERLMVVAVPFGVAALTALAATIFEAAGPQVNDLERIAKIVTAACFAGYALVFARLSRK